MRINCKGKLVDLTEPKIMGILNTTPDSFFAGSRSQNIDSALKRIEKLLEEGADFIDIGGMSTRPGSAEVSETEELERVVPVVEAAVHKFPEILISVDTYRAKVARETIETGAAILNDISAGSMDENLFQTVAALQVPYILMHMQGTPQNMQQNPVYDDVTLEVNQFLSEKIRVLKELGVNDIILDPGFGFGKTVQHNYELFKNMDLLGFGEFPLLVGISRKSMITRLLDIPADEALNGTTVLNTLALQKGAKILRVHDVKEAQQTLMIWKQFQ
ncbi:dihydropteroate synthase [Moheibacter sp.]|uniref:dihydropteroate synthase n=1 Tax=Moheibacter sp. TaxID=1965316 RepID=UPI003C78D68B